MAKIDPAINGYNSERTQQFYRDVLERLRSLPGVLSAGQAVQRILDGAERRNSITVEGYTPPPDDLMLTSTVPAQDGGRSGLQRIVWPPPTFLERLARDGSRLLGYR
jgi:hypothetical protein